MKKLVRFGISLDHHLLENFDRVITKKGYSTRSEAIRDLIRDHLVGQAWDENKEVVGTITIVYSHHVRELADSLVELQHHYSEAIKSSLHVHLDDENCLEVLVVRGRSGEVKKIADKLIGTKGVKHGRLSTTTIGRDLS